MTEFVTNILSNILTSDCSKDIMLGVIKKQCMSILLSKSISYAIIFFSFTLKLPIIKNLMNSKSAEGISEASTWTEIFTLMLNALYAYHFGNPFSTYAENVIILFQSVIILLLIWKYSPKKVDMSKRTPIIITFILIAFLCIQDKFIPESVWTLVGSITIPLISFARFAQIRESYIKKSTGPLSLFTFILGFGGCIARAFTTYTETDDRLLLFTYIYAAILNGIIMVQILVYGDKSSKKVADKNKKD